MNNKLLLHRKIKFPTDEYHIGFLNYIHPGYVIVNDLSQYDRTSTKGMIYTGKLCNDTISQIERFTKNWIIVTDKEFEIDLTSNEGLLKHLLPLEYIKIHKTLKKGEDKYYNTLSYDKLLHQIKYCLLTGEFTIVTDESKESCYALYSSLLCTPQVFNRQFFNTVNKTNVSLIISSVMTFLCKVQSKSIAGESPSYTRLILQSNRKYGKKIQQAVVRFLKSKSNREISLFNLLSYLNKA